MSNMKKFFWGQYNIPYAVHGMHVFQQTSDTELYFSYSYRYVVICGINLSSLINSVSFNIHQEYNKLATSVNCESEDA